MRFWARMFASSLWVNLPVAWAVAAGRLGMVAGGVYAGTTGFIMLAIWDGLRRNAAAPSPAHVDLDAVVTGGAGRVRWPLFGVLHQAPAVDGAAQQV